jgi:hypothetical protein
MPKELSLPGLLRIHRRRPLKLTAAARHSRAASIDRPVSVLLVVARSR